MEDLQVHHQVSVFCSATLKNQSKEKTLKTSPR